MSLSCSSPLPLGCLGLNRMNFPMRISNHVLIFFFFFDSLLHCYVRLSLVATSRDCSLVAGDRLLMVGPLLPRTGSGVWASVVVAHGLQGAECWGTSLVAAAPGLPIPGHVGSSQTRNRTHVPCTGRQIPSQGNTREVPLITIKNPFTAIPPVSGLVPWGTLKISTKEQVSSTSDLALYKGFGYTGKIMLPESRWWTNQRR